MKPTPVTQGVEEESESDDDYGPETAPQEWTSIYNFIL
jgi:hypothetical protein